MVKLSRLDLISQYVHEHGEARLTDVFEMFPDISSMTIRRDLEKLEQRGSIMRMRGKVKAVTRQYKFKEESYSHRVNENMEGKQIIARKALKYIQRGCSMFFDAGTTSMQLANQITSGDYFILTSGPNIALELIKKEGVSVILTGGHMDRDFLNVTGVNAMNLIENINIDIAFLVPSGFSLDGQFTVGNAEHAELKKLIIKKARTVIMLMDSTKLDKNLPYTFAKLSNVDVLICDQPLPDVIIKEANKYDAVII